MEKEKKVSSREVYEVLKKVALGELEPKLKHPEAFDVFYSDTPFIVGNWEIEIFFDCGEFDYVSYVTSPDGRKGNYKDWAKETKEYNPPAAELDKKLYKTMVDKFKNTK